MNIYLIRHGQTEWNAQGRIQGREDIPLSEEGIQQAHDAGRDLSALAVDAILTSPLSRASYMAEILSVYIDAPIVKDERLTERDFGVLSGIKTDIFNPGEDAEGLEPLDDVSRRMLSAIIEHAAKARGDIAAVSHGGSINAVLRTLSGGEIGSGKTTLKNASVCVLGYEEGKFSILDYDMTSVEFRDKYLK